MTGWLKAMEERDSGGVRAVSVGVRVGVGVGGGGNGQWM